MLLNSDGSLVRRAIFNELVPIILRVLSSDFLVGFCHLQKVIGELEKDYLIYHTQNVRNNNVPMLFGVII